MLVKRSGLEQDLVLAVMDHVVGQVLSLGMLAYVLVHSFLVEHGNELKQLLPSETNHLRRAAIQAGAGLSLGYLGRFTCTRSRRPPLTTVK